MNVLGYRMVERMGELDMTSRQLAKISGIHVNTLYRYVTGRSEPTMSKLLLLSQSLGVSVDWLVGNDEVADVELPGESVGGYCFSVSKKVVVKAKYFDEARRAAERTFIRMMSEDVKAGIGRHPNFAIQYEGMV